MPNIHQDKPTAQRELELHLLMIRDALLDVLSGSLAIPVVHSAAWDGLESVAECWKWVRNLNGRPPHRATSVPEPCALGLRWHNDRLVISSVSFAAHYGISHDAVLRACVFARSQVGPHADEIEQADGIFQLTERGANYVLLAYIEEDGTLGWDCQSRMVFLQRAFDLTAEHLVDRN